MGSKAINSALGKKLIDKGIESLPDIVKFGLSKIKNKNVLWALDSDIANYVIEEAQNRTQNQLTLTAVKREGHIGGA